MNTSRTGLLGDTASMNALAIVGFVALVAGGIWLAIYSTRFVPMVVNRAGEASVYVADSISITTHRVGSFFSPTPRLSVVPTPIASTTISFGDAVSTTTATSTLPAPASHPQRVKTAAGGETSGSYSIGGSDQLSGLPDLIVSVDAIGYLATSSADSFAASPTVPAGSRPAVKFTIKNSGTNVADPWRFSASIPTSSGYVYQSQPQQPLNPGDSIDYTLGFDQANIGTNETVTIIANFDHAIQESDTTNDSASAQVTILGN